MALLARGWSLSDGNVVGTVTYTYDSPWTTYTYLHTISSQVVTPPSPPTGMAQGQTQSSDTTCTTATSTSAHAATAPSMTLTQPGTDYASTTSPTAHPTSLADESASVSASGSALASGRGASLSSGASFGVVSPSPALTQALAGSSSAGQPTIPTGSSGNVIASASSGRGMGKGAIAAIALAVVLAVALGCALCWVCRRRRRRGGRRRESSFIQYPFLWRSDAASAVASMSEAPSRAVTPAATPTPAEWDTFGERDAEVAESARTAAATVASSTGALPGYGGGLVLGDEKSQLPPVATGPSLSFSAAFPLSSPVSLSPATAVPATSPSPNTPLALAPPPTVHDADMLPSPASTVPYGYAWDHPPALPSSGGRRQSSGTVSVSYSTAMADSEVGSRPPSYSRY